MIAIVASRLDPEANAIAAAWSPHNVALLGAEDLTSSGWEFEPSEPAIGTAVVEGRRVRVADLQAVLTRRPAVLAEELKTLAATDRSYAAAEINAFLVAWLSALPCVVVNRPTPTCLCGPAWDNLHWQCAAASAGVEWVETATDEQKHEVVICGATCLFAKNANQERAAHRLARVARVDLLSVTFQGDRVSQVTAAPSLQRTEVQDCLLRHLLRQA